MKKIFIDNIKETDKIESMFLVKEKNLAISKNGKPYLNLKLGDKTGEVDARVWEDAKHLSSLFEKGDFIRVQSRATRYQNNIQLVLFSLEKCLREDIFLDDFLECGVTVFQCKHVHGLRSTGRGDQCD